MLLNITESTMPLWASIPFILMLLMIAVCPLVGKIEHWWEKNINKLLVSLILGTPVAVLLIMNDMSHNLIHQLLFDYIPFIILLGSLFVITGGIHLKGDIEATPKINTMFLAVGSILASIMGTTGAAMLLIRPIIRTNAERKFKVHTILFFIACVANCGGLLTPLGDPPLFLLYLRGAEFTWFLNLLPEWAFTLVLLLLVYYILDCHYYKKENPADILLDKTLKDPIKLEGKLNFLWLVGIVCAVAFINPGTIPAMGQEDAPFYMKFLREIVLVVLIIASLLTTKKKVRTDNKYSWTPIIEVAVLFLGIFTTMIPTMVYLKSHAASWGLDSTWQFYYLTGAMSSFLDNAPTALAFHGVASGLTPETVALMNSATVAGIPEILLKAISVGAVFFGAMTYIGNGPNFMVKSIAEENGIKMPSFFGYILKFSLIILLPIYVLTQVIFLWLIPML
ncbi:MAG: sodium:proton antiporter [Bacteroidales bacterium]|nr:sodium:proton antiporter [Bacteroidales bacterium]